MRNIRILEQRGPFGIGPRRANFGQFGVHGAHIVDSLRQRAKALIEQNVRLPDQATEFTPVGIGVRHQCEIAVLGTKRTPFLVENSHVPGRTFRRQERRAVKVLGHHIGNQRLEHRDFDRLPQPRLFALIERCQDGGENRARTGLVRDDGRNVSRLARHDRLQVRQTGPSLDDVVVSRLRTQRTVGTIPIGGKINQPGVQLLKLGVTDTEARG